MSEIGDIIGCPHPTLRCRPIHPPRGHDSPPRYILAQGPKVDHKLFISYAHRHPFGGVMSPACSLLITHRQRLAVLRVVCSPPSVNPATARLHPSFPSHSVHRSPDSSRAITRGLSSVYLPLDWTTPLPIRPMRNHLPVDGVAHRTIPFTVGVSRMPMINSHLVSLTPSLPP